MMPLLDRSKVVKERHDFLNMSKEIRTHLSNFEVFDARGKVLIEWPAHLASKDRLCRPKNRIRDSNKVAGDQCQGFIGPGILVATSEVNTYDNPIFMCSKRRSHIWVLPPSEV